ncbi:MAG: hypothetical protein ACT4PT_09405 [Methanobacteriota archaeon]
MTVPFAYSPALAGDGDPITEPDICETLGYARSDTFSSIGVAAFKLAGRNGTLPPAGDPDFDLLMKMDDGEGTTKVCRTDPQCVEGQSVCGPPCDPSRTFCNFICDPQIQPCPPQSCNPRTTACWQPCQPGTPSCFQRICLDQCVIQTEIVAMQLVSVNPIIVGIVEESPRWPSVGAINGVHRNPTNGDPLGGRSFFDVIVEINITGGPVNIRGTNCFDATRCNPFRVEANLDTTMAPLPPIRDFDPPYQHPLGSRVVVWNETGAPLGELLSGCHKPFLNVFGVPGHRICLIGTGDTTPDGVGATCLQNRVQLGVTDVSTPAHTIAGVAATTSGPLSLTPWVPTVITGEIVWVSFASTSSVPCANVGISVSAAYTDGHTSATVAQAWQQHH